LAKSLGTNLQPSDIPEHRCAKNWDQSSKAMEPHGIVACAINIWNSGKAWLRVFVSDDDSSSRAALRHSVESRMVIENLLQWPLDSGGKKLRVQENFQLICLNQLFFWQIHLIDDVFMENICMV